MTLDGDESKSKYTRKWERAVKAAEMKMKKCRANDEIDKNRLKIR